VREVSGDVEVSATVTFPSSPSCGAGLVLRPSRSRNDVLWFGPVAGAKDTTVTLTVQRDVKWPDPLRQLRWAPDRPVHLVVQRVGDWLITRWGPDRTRLEDHGPALYFPVDGPVDVGIFASNYDEREPAPAARFEAIDVRVAR
jgi:hypothetical protein